MVYTLPSPIPHSGMSVHINLAPSYAVSARSGFLFSPEFCQGQSPIVCQSGPLYKSTTHGCARGLIFNQTRLAKHCRFDVQKGTNDTIIRQVSRELYIISTWGEELKFRCPHEVERAMTLTAGTYKFHCKPPCVIEGASFQVECMTTYHLGAAVAPPHIQVRSTFNFSEVLKAPHLMKAFPQLKDTPSALIPAVNADLLIGSAALENTPRVSLAKHVPVASLILSIFLVFIVIFFVSAYCYYRKGAPCGPQWLKNKAARARMSRLTTVTPLVTYRRPNTLVSSEAEVEEAIHGASV